MKAMNQGVTISQNKFKDSYLEFIHIIVNKNNDSLSLTAILAIQ